MWFNVLLVIFLIMNFFIILVCLGTILNNQKQILLNINAMKVLFDAQDGINKAQIGSVKELDKALKEISNQIEVLKAAKSKKGNNRYS